MGEGRITKGRGKRNTQETFDRTLNWIKAIARIERIQQNFNKFEKEARNRLKPEDSKTNCKMSISIFAPDSIPYFARQFKFLDIIFQFK